MKKFITTFISITNYNRAPDVFAKLETLCDTDFTLNDFKNNLDLIFKYAHPIFKTVFKKYDNLNNSVQENVKGMRVVKSFVREEYEQKKFDFNQGFHKRGNPART